MNPFKYVGRRIIKTGIAVFLTALVCLKLDLPVIFAVIAAIVTTEPTTADSLKKGIIRLPAAAIGAGFALIFDLILGHAAITFALVSMLTILFCYRFKLDNGTLVATLTAVAMIPSSNDSLISEFIVRLSGTSIGIIISTLVNFSVLPPKFGPLLVQKVNELYNNTAFHLVDVISALVEDKERNNDLKFRELHKQLEKAFQLCEYQASEWQYRKSCHLQERSFHFLQKKLAQLQKIIFHTGNLNYINFDSELTNNEKKIVESSVNFMKKLFTNILSENKKTIVYTQKQLYQLLKEEIKNKAVYGSKEAFLHELIAILDCLSILHTTTIEEQHFSQKNKNYPAYIFTNPVQYD